MYVVAVVRYVARKSKSESGTNRISYLLASRRLVNNNKHLVEIRLCPLYGPIHIGIIIRRAEMNLGTTPNPSAGMSLSDE